MQSAATTVVMGTSLDLKKDNSQRGFMCFDIQTKMDR